MDFKILASGFSSVSAFASAFACASSLLGSFFSILLRIKVLNYKISLEVSLEKMSAK